MPQWAGSCWYYLRFCDPRNGERFVGEEAERYWMERVNVGYRKPEAGNASRPAASIFTSAAPSTRCCTCFTRDSGTRCFSISGYVSTPEPFQRLVNQGIILGEDGRKMSKRWGNVIDPLDVIAEYGADAFRCYEMFMGPLEQMKPWSMNGVEGVSRFLARVWRLVMEENQAGEWVLSSRRRRSSRPARSSR